MDKVGLWRFVEIGLNQEIEGVLLQNFRMFFIKEGIMDKKALWISLLAVAAVSPLAMGAEGRDSLIPKKTVQADEKLPKVIAGFKGLDFDARGERRAFLMSKNNAHLPFDLMDIYVDGLDVEQKINYNTIMALGRSLDEIEVQGKNLGQVAEDCGFHRLRDFYEFKKKNKGKFFLDNKEPLYASSLIAEMVDFEEASAVFPVDDWLFLKRHLIQEGWHYAEKYPNFHRLYNENLHHKVEKRLRMEKEMLQAKTR